MDQLQDQELVEAFREALKQGAFETIPDYEIID